MPNWTYNSITFSGDPEKLEALKQQVGLPTEVPGMRYVRDEDNKVVLDENNLPTMEKTTYKEDSPIFSMWNIVRPAIGDYEAYRDQGWYDWNVDNWGTKWDVDNVEVLEEGEDTWQIQFSTAWAPPHEALVALSQQHPDILIRNEWLEEQGFGAHQEYSGGTYWTDKEWDVPQSHAEQEENVGEETCYCYMTTVEDEFPFDDCPRPQSETQVAVADFEKASEVV